MPYLPGLDGMRALAVVAVMVFHADHDWFPAGFLGVEVFFVISGYLITLLLIAEHERSGFISLRAFWGRRARRLLPALYVTLLAVIAYCALFLRDPLGKLRGDTVAALFYVSNWFQIWIGQSYAALADFVPLRHLWSLAVEEQFYLVWPLVMVVILRRGHANLPKIGLWLFGISLAITIGTALFFHSGFYNVSVEDFPSAYFEVFGRSIDKNNFLYLGTISRSSGILLGAAFAMIWRPVAVMRGPMREKGRTLDVLAIVGLVGLVLLMATYELIDAFDGTYFSALFRGGFLLTGLCTLAVIAAVTHGGSFVGKFLGNKVLNWVGTRSYGLYLYHWPIYQMIRKQAGIALTFPKFLLAMIITAIVAEASYRFIEMPIRRREFFAFFRDSGPRFMVAMGAVGLLLGYSVVSLAGADVRCTSKIECDSEAAAAANDLDDDTTSVPPTSTTVFDATSTSAAAVTTVPGQVTTLPPATAIVPTTLLRETVPVLAIGESVMQGAQSVLVDNGVRVDANESIQGKGVIEQLQASLAQLNITEAVVIQSGTNGPVTQEQYDEMANLLVGVPKVFFMTIKAPRDWVAGNNEKIRALPSTHPNVQVIDWEAQGATIEGELSQSDGGIHLNSGTAVRFYANLILSALGRPTIPEPTG